MSKQTGIEITERPLHVKLWTRLNVRLSHKDRLMFTKYLSVLLKSGLPIDNAIETLLSQAKGPLKVILLTLHTTLKRGDPLAKGLEAYPQVFDLVYLNLIRAGEASGTLQTNLEHLVEQLQKEHDLRQKIRGAMIYPVTIILAALAISIGIIVFILPSIQDVFSALHAELPLPTRILLWIARVTTESGSLVVLCLIAFFIFVIIIRRIKAVQPMIHTILIHLPLIGPMSRRVNIGRSSRLMGTMLVGGMSIDEILPIIRTVLKNALYKKMFIRMEEEVSQGESTSAVYAHFPQLIPPMALRMIYVGEQTGSLPEMLLYLADFYEKEIDEVTKSLASLLEPFLLIFIGVMVGGLALSIMMPIYQVVGQF
ncbi:MAG: Type IV pilin [Candidatus Uhrbacteria bacterium GW2011_GWE2_40_58]|nr:MAG: Type IV pilin [Candidatus Uhrbacteria bacterium GW2011_GWF2_40_263]KKR67908.1 MAG: Type IV pilin [Candidatus Uhrbacteria bacterium GW2011_GWE2_40_58]OGL92508.1 MAG: hypothetical protein A2239_01700 [Candidatus Uhrbacteria bacterium RIFOXYA2_FULL_40_9]OGL96877.1 MAG: hypothetical protein A2332_02035 [Candidatus Uhrbacteria bacterium RIFOXYB2_FULL_41_18]HBK34528.1 hypothetical protein [Candidatus Uhrbacteria bacterium]